MVFPFSSQVFFNISMAIYLFCFLGYLIFTASRNKIIGTLSTSLLIIGLVTHSVGLLARWLETHQTGYGYVPLSNMYESLIFFSWTIVLIYLILEFKYRQKIIGVFVTPFAFLAIALTSIVPWHRCKDYAPDACAAEQLAGYPCDNVLFWICLFCCILRGQHPLFDSGQKRFL